MKSRSFIYVSLAVDFLIAVSKFTAAAFTGSSTMVAEGIHSVIDTISQLLLIWGVKVSSRPADVSRPFGYGRELYFWSFIVSLIFFIVGGCVSLYEGIARYDHPEFAGTLAWNYGTLGIALVFTGISMYTVRKAFNAQRGRTSFWKAIKESKDPSTFITLMGDAGDIAGLFIAFCGITLSRILHNPHYDGMASILIGAMLICISLVLVRESKSLLMGEAGSRRALKRIVALAESDQAVIKIKKHLSMYLAPEEVILQLNTVFKDGLDTREITDAIERITHLLKKEFPRIKQIFIEPVRADGK